MSTTERPLRRDAERNRQRILDSASELFTERGLSVTLNDVAHHAGVGVGTVYRRFPDKEQLIDALFEDKIAELIGHAEDALANPDPWQGLVSFLTANLEGQVADQGLKEVLLGSDQGRERIAGARRELAPRVERLIARAQAQGALREDIEGEDFGIVMMMIGTVIDTTRQIEPELWRRYLALILRGMSSTPMQEPLPVPALAEAQADACMQAWRPPRR
jgi:AcrR family transcriptional regulator